MLRLFRHGAPLAALLGLVTTIAGAQSLPRPRLALGAYAGAAQYDLSGTGTTHLLALRLEGELTRWLILEGGVGTMRPAEQFGQRIRYWSYEGQLQAQWPLGRVRPYLGVGGGVWDGNDGLVPKGTTSGALGARITPGTDRLDLRAELRVRGIGSNFAGSVAEWTTGIAYRF
jgi:hypothetical protein